MNRFASASFVLALLPNLLAAPAAAAAPPLFAADGAKGTLSNLYLLDPATGATLQTIGPIGYSVTGLAFQPTTGVLYGTTGGRSPTSPNHLIRIDVNTGAGTVVGPHGVMGPAADITFSADGQLYGWFPRESQLGTIDSASGAATIVGNVDSDGGTSGLAFSAAGVLYRSRVLNPSYTLETINPVLGTTNSSIPFNPMIAFNSLAFDSNDVLYGTTSTDTSDPSRLATINPATGAVSVLGFTVNNLDALAFAVPEPASILVLGIGIGLLSFIRRRQSTAIQCM
jgi:hypothetical protein